MSGPSSPSHPDELYIMEVDEYFGIVLYEVLAVHCCWGRTARRSWRCYRRAWRRASGTTTRPHRGGRVGHRAAVLSAGAGGGGRNT